MIDVLAILARLDSRESRFLANGIPMLGITSIGMGDDGRRIEFYRGCILEFVSYNRDVVEVLR